MYRGNKTDTTRLSELLRQLAAQVDLRCHTYTKSISRTLKIKQIKDNLHQNQKSNFNYFLNTFLKQGGGKNRKQNIITTQKQPL
jgi:hypothetical protein